MMKTYQAPWGKALMMVSSLLVVLAVGSVVAGAHLRPYVSPAILADWFETRVVVISPEGFVSGLGF